MWTYQRHNTTNCNPDDKDAHWYIVINKQNWSIQFFKTFSLENGNIKECTYRCKHAWNKKYNEIQTHRRSDMIAMLRSPTRSNNSQNLVEQRNCILRSKSKLNCQWRLKSSSSTIVDGNLEITLGGKTTSGVHDRVYKGKNNKIISA